MEEKVIEVKAEEFKRVCLDRHQRLRSPVMMFFASDERAKEGAFVLRAVFREGDVRWHIVKLKVPALTPSFPSIAREIYSANLFEREIREMYGLEPVGNPDTRRLRLHEEVWPEGFYPLRKDFDPAKVEGEKGRYVFNKVEGEGIFEVPVGPVHAGIIGPGHFRFSAAGEPIIDLDIRLGFTHRGVEKLLERKLPKEALKLIECVAGDSTVAHSLAFCRAAEQINGVVVPDRAVAVREIYLELERMYNHIAAIGGIALDVGFSAASAYASILKEDLHQLNDRLTGHRFMRGAIMLGGVAKDLDEEAADVKQTLRSSAADLAELKKLLMESVSFLDRVETTGQLKKKTAEDLGVVGLAARASARGRAGDVLARLNARLEEFERACQLICSKMGTLPDGEISAAADLKKEGTAIGFAEGARGPVLHWLALDGFGAIRRCKIVDPSFHNWPGLAYAVQGNIIPDFPVCNKSFDLSYSGNDL